MTICTIDWGAVFTALGVIAELLVAWVIYYEWEVGKLDRFLEDADKLADERNRIYRDYCGLALSGAQARSDAFTALIEQSSELQAACHQNIRLMSRIGARLPRTPFFKRTPLEWHVAAILWMILSSYVDKRREESGRTFAQTFLRYALLSIRQLLKQKRDRWMVRDPERTRKQDFEFSRQEMEAAVLMIRTSLKRKS